MGLNLNYTSERNSYRAVNAGVSFIKTRKLILYRKITSLFIWELHETQIELCDKTQVSLIAVHMQHVVYAGL